MSSRMSIRQAAMDAIAQEIAALETGALAVERRRMGYQPVVGAGSLDAAIVLIGEAPGAREATTGLPFVGASGRLLDELLASIGLRREGVYITNVVKDRPPENRDPTPAELALYRPFLVRQLAIIQPRALVTLGRFAMYFVLELCGVELPHPPKISDLHGQTLHGIAPYAADGETPVAIVPLFHPAVALYSGSRKGTLLADMAALRPFVEGAE